MIYLDLWDFFFDIILINDDHERARESHHFRDSGSVLRDELEQVLMSQIITSLRLAKSGGQDIHHHLHNLSIISDLSLASKLFDC